MKPLGEAQREVLDAVEPLPVITVGLADAHGLALAEDVHAPHDVPPFPNSGMDGYAVRSADVAVPVDLTVIEDVPAGSVPTRAVVDGTAVKIMTGAPIPEGADAVVPVEDTEPGEGVVRILASRPPGANVRAAGGDVAEGGLVFAAGTRLDARAIGVLAALGVRPTVRRRPVVAVLSTGDELVSPDTVHLEPGMIRDSNRPMLVSLLAEAGCEVADLGIVRDDRAALAAALGEAAAVADVVVSSGGVSMGEHDLVKAVLAELGTVGFWKVAMRPGKPFAFGSVAGTPFFGLPGNPVSVFVSFEQFLRPTLLAMMGCRALFRQRAPAIAGEELPADPQRLSFVRVTTRRDGGRIVAESAGGQGSNMLTATSRADAFAVVPAGRPVAAGDHVELELFRSPEVRTREEALG